MKIGILGAGAEGAGLGGLLTREQDIQVLKFGDINQDSLNRVNEQVGALNRDTRLESRVVNALDTDDVANWAEGLDIIINTTVPKCNLAIMYGCLAAGTHYMDFNGGPFEIEGIIPFDETIDAQFELNFKFAKIDRLAISCAGVAPGWVDLIARYQSESYEIIDSVTIRWVEWNNATDLISTVGPSLIANFNLPRPIRWQDGRVVDVDHFESEEIYKWPAPIGDVALYTGFLHPELRTIQNIGRDIGRIEVKSGLSNGRWTSSRKIWIEALRRQLDNQISHGDIDLATRLGRSFIPPEKYSDAIARGLVSKGYFGVSVQMDGSSGGQHRSHTVSLVVELNEARKHIPWGTHMVYATAGTTPIVLATMLGRGEIADRGVVGVGGLSCWRQALKRISDRGHSMTEEVKVVGDLVIR